jgi:DNA-binding transcriptional MerR regulator
MAAPPQGGHPEREGIGEVTGLLNHLEGLGFDLSAVRDALSMGNNATARSLLDQFFEDNRETLPGPPGREISNQTADALDTLEEGPGRIAPDRGGRMLGLLEKFEELGYDMTAIRAAIAAGDEENAQSLMRQFMEEHKDELPAPPAGGKAGGMTGFLDHFEELGYDMSAIREAVESGDAGTAQSLMRQFMKEHKDELPAPPAGCRTGPVPEKTA